MQNPPIRGTTDVLFCVADPVAQVKAPEAYNLVFAAAGVDVVVLPARVSASHLAGFVRESLALGNARGLFVSIPHKTPLMGVLDRFDRVAEAAGAVNAVRRAADGALEGALFDGAGFVGALRHHRVDIVGRRALLVGAGGAGLAIASALAETGLAELAVFDVDPARAAALVQRVAPLSPHPLRCRSAPAPAGFDLVIQATPLGLGADDPLPLDPAQLAPGATLMDILMTARPTPLVRACRERGLAAHMGHEMLVQQMPATLDYFGFPALAAAVRQPGSPWLQAVRQHIFPAPTPNA